MKNILLLMLLGYAGIISAQQHIPDLQAPSDAANIYSQKLFGDSLSSSFVIIIKDEVKLHKHVSHSEHVYVVSGQAHMKVGNDEMDVKEGDLIFIPKNTPHQVKVTSNIPLKVISIQSPLFDGKDRIVLE